MTPPSRRAETVLPRYALDHRIAILVLFAATIVIGAVAAAGIPIELIPRGYENPFLAVFIPWGDAPAEEVLEKITVPLEEELSTVKGIDRIASSSSTGSASAMLAFKQGTDMVVAYREVRDRIERARRLFPDDVQHVFIRKDDPASLPAYVVGVALDPDVSDPYELVQKEIINRIERLPGVASVQASGHEQKEVLIELDREATEAAGLNIYQIAQQLSDDNFTMASGDVRDSGRTLLVRSIARYRSLDDIRRVRVSSSVRLGDIATIRYEAPETDFSARAMNRPAVALVVFKEGEANGREVATRVADEVRQIEENPRLAGFEMIRLFSQSEVIDETLRILVSSGVFGGLLAAAVLLFFLRRVRLTLVVAASIPLSLVLALTVMFFVGESLNMLSLLGLMMCIGLLVDNAVVVSENIHRLHRDGLSRRDAVIQGTGEMTLAVTMSTLTTIIVFLPVFLVEGTHRFFFLRLAIPVSVSLLASLAVALIFVPLCVWMTLPRAGAVSPGAATRASAPRRALDAVLVRAYELTFGAASRVYSSVLAWFLPRRIVLVALSAGLFLASLAGMWAGLVPFVGVQRDTEAGFDLKVEMPDGTTFNEAREWFARAEAVLDEQRDALGLGGWYVVFRRNGGDIRGWYEHTAGAELTPRQATALLKERLPESPGVKVYGREEAQSVNKLGRQFYQLNLYGEDPRALEDSAASLEEFFEKIDGVVGIQRSGDEQPNELGLVVNRDRMRRYGASPRVVAGLVSYALRGSSLPRFSKDGRETPVRIRYQLEDRRNLQQLESFKVPTDSGEVLPIGTLTDAHLLAAPIRINRRNKRIARTITLELEDGRETETRARIFEILRGIDLPEGISFVPETGTGQLARDVAALRMTTALSVAFIYLLMGFLFESVVLPLSIVFTIPLAFIGVFGLHWIVGQELDFLGAVGFILLCGVVVNNGIVLIDYLHRLRREGLARDEAVLLAAQRRFRPIMMTAITTIGGLLPLAFAPATNFGLSYYSFSLALIGGMSTATLLTLLVIPVFYTLFDDAWNAVRGSVARGIARGRGTPAAGRA